MHQSISPKVFIVASAVAIMFSSNGCRRDHETNDVRATGNNAKISQVAFEIENDGAKKNDYSPLLTLENYALLYLNDEHLTTPERMEYSELNAEIPGVDVDWTKKVAELRERHLVTLEQDPDYHAFARQIRAQGQRYGACFELVTILICIKEKSHPPEFLLRQADRIDSLCKASGLDSYRANELLQALRRNENFSKIKCMADALLETLMNELEIKAYRNS